MLWSLSVLGLHDMGTSLLGVASVTLLIVGVANSDGFLAMISTVALSSLNILFTGGLIGLRTPWLAMANLPLISSLMRRWCFCRFRIFLDEEVSTSLRLEYRAGERLHGFGEPRWHATLPLFPFFLND